MGGSSCWASETRSLGGQGAHLCPGPHPHHHSGSGDQRWVTPPRPHHPRVPREGSLAAGQGQSQLTSEAEILSCASPALLSAPPHAPRTSWLPLRSWVPVLCSPHLVFLSICPVPTECPPGDDPAVASPANSSPSQYCHPHIAGEQGCRKKSNSPKVTQP